MRESFVSPDLNYVLDNLKDRTKQEINCHRLGKITSFDASKLTCEVELLERYESKGVVLEYPVLTDCPLIITATTKSFLTMGNIVGSECVVFFNDTDYSNWFETGVPTLPYTPRKHSLTDGFVMLRPFSELNHIENFVYDLANIVLGTVSTNLQIQDNLINLHTPANKLEIAEGDNNKITLATATNKLEIDETGAKTTLQNGTTQITLDTLVEIKNATNSLKIILDAWLDACKGITINPTTMQLADSGASFDAIKTLLAGVMK